MLIFKYLHIMILGVGFSESTDTPRTNENYAKEYSRR